MRKKIFDLLNVMYSTYAIGQHSGYCEDPYVVLKFNSQEKSMSGALGGFQTFEVLAYVPDSSIVSLDSMIESIRTILITEGFECTDRIGPDFNDTSIKAYMRSIEFRNPRGLD